MNGNPSNPETLSSNPVSTEQQRKDEFAQWFEAIVREHRPSANEAFQAGWDACMRRRAVEMTEFPECLNLRCRATGECVGTSPCISVRPPAERTMPPGWASMTPDQLAGATIPEKRTDPTETAIDWPREVTAILEGLGSRAIRVREGGGPENLAMSLAVTVANLALP